MPTILLVCAGNTCRSPMAAGLLRDKLNIESPELISPGLQILTAGLHARAGMPASDEALTVMREINIDISHHSACQLTDEMIAAADLILTMTISQCLVLRDRFPYKWNAIYALGEYTGIEGEVLDPFGQGLNVYRRSLQQLELMVDRLVDKIIESKMR